MLFVVVGVLLVVLKILDIWPVMYWSWIGVLAPFGLAIAWWAWLDATGSTQRAAVREMEEKKAARRRKAMDALRIHKDDRS